MLRHPHSRIGKILAAGALAAFTSVLAVGPSASASTAPTISTHGSAVTASSALPVPPKVDLHARAATALAHVTAGSKAVMAQRGHAIVQPQASGYMTYHGGPVAHSPRVYLLFWGSQWSSDPNGVESYLYYYFNGLGQSGDGWSRITSQYTDYTGLGPSFGGAVFAGWAQDTSTAPTYSSQAQLAAEAVAGADYFGATGTDAQVVVLSPTGTHPDNFPNAGFCAYHSTTNDPSGNFVAWTNMPYVLDAGGSCGANTVSGPLDGFSIVGGHEYAETITDTALNAWYDTSLSGEIGDKCAWTGLFLQGTPYGSFAQQTLWSNAAGGCVQ